MTTAAWVMLLTTWGVVGFLTVRFFLKVLRTPLRPDEDEDPPSD